MSDAQLDELLHTARWPEFSIAADERVRRTWRSNFAQRRLWLRIAPLAAAAMIAVTAMLWGPSWFKRSAKQQVSEVAVVANIQAVAQTRLIVREPDRNPNVYEKLAGLSPKLPPRNVAAPIAVIRDEPADDVAALLRSGRRGDLDRFLRLVSRSETRDEALSALRSMQHPPVEMLMAALRSGRVDHRLAAAMSIGNICQDDVVNRLILMVERNEHRREALAALVRCHRPQAAQFLRMARQKPSIEAQLRSVEVQMKHVLS